MPRPRKPEAELQQPHDRRPRQHRGGRGDRRAGRSGPHDDGRLHAPQGAGAAGPRGGRSPSRRTAERVELHRIGVNLNQIARALNSGASAPSGTLEAVERVGELAAGLLSGEALDR